jgi:transcription termination/antitermination protein NusA
MTKEIVEAVGVLEREKGISADRLMAALEDALLSAYKKTPEAAKYARVEVDRSSGDFRVYELLLPPDLEEQLLDEVEEEAGEPTVDPETGEMVYPEPPEIDQERLMQYRDQIEERDVTPHDFGRIAAQTAKQVILQRIREAERDMMFNEYQDRVGELITGIVQQSDSRYTLVQLRERVEALLPRGEQVHGERYDHGQRIKAIITDVSNQAKGPSIIVSRRSPELIRALFELEVPEIADGLVEIQNVAREPGYRSKIAVVSHASGVDPVGACVGPRGSRVRMVVSELRGEKIDIIPFNEEPARFVAKALSPARVREVLVDDEAKQATVIVPDDQLSLAIGKDGLNARLAARLTGWRVDIRSETEFAEEEAEMGYQEEEVSGRCAAILANGKRCPNASLPGSRYCGLPAHQALEGTGTDYLVPPEDEGDEEPDGDGDGTVPEDSPVEVVSAEDAADEAPVGETASSNGDLVVEDLVAEDAAEQATRDDAIDEDAVEDAIGNDAAEDATDEDDLEDAIDEDPLAEAPLEDAVAEPPVDDDPADTSTADQPTDQEPIVDADPVPEDPPEDPDGPVPTEPDEDLDSDHVAAHDLPSEPIDSETATPDESAADEDES